MEGINKDNIDQWMFDYVEGNLDASKVQEFEQFISDNPIYKKELEGWQKSFVTDENINFPGKDSLLKSTTLWQSIYFKVGATFTIIILLFSSYWWMNQSIIKISKEKISTIDTTKFEQDDSKEELFTDNFEKKNYDFKIVSKPIAEEEEKHMDSKQVAVEDVVLEVEAVKSTETIEKKKTPAEEVITTSLKKEPIEKVQTKSVYTKADKMPRYPGGNIALFKYFDKHLDYPKQARKNKVEGNVLLKFIVTKTGDIKDIIVAKGIGSGCDEEAINVLKKSGKWIPGKINGEAVDVMIGVPFEFKLK